MERLEDAEDYAERKENKVEKLYDIMEEHATRQRLQPIISNSCLSRPLLQLKRS
jgi:hypothetical protein